jgi:hypothetical protein
MSEKGSVAPEDCSLSARNARTSGMCARYKVEFVFERFRYLELWYSPLLLPPVITPTTHTLPTLPTHTLTHTHIHTGLRFQFTLTGVRLYAFWVSASAGGESGGYLGAGGPGYRNGWKDT